MTNYNKDEPMIELKNIYQSYRKSNRQVDVLRGLNLSIKNGEFVSIMGPSGSGKTTLLNIIGGLERPTRGQMVVNSHSLESLRCRELADWRAKNIGFVFQFYNLIAILNALQNVELPLSLHGENKSTRRQKALNALELVGIKNRATHFPSELSGGEQQRVAIARAIVGGARLLLCDEPTGDLDRETGFEIINLLSTLNREFGVTTVMVTHDPKVAEYGDRTVRLDKGNIELIQDNSKEEGREYEGALL